MKKMWLWNISIMIKLKDILNELFVEGRFSNSMDTVRIEIEFSKPAQNVIETAIKNGVASEDDMWDAQAVYHIPFNKAWTKEELEEELTTFKENNNLTYVAFLGGQLIQLDSMNMSHAGAYYIVGLSVKRDEAIRAGLV